MECEHCNNEGATLGFNPDGEIGNYCSLCYFYFESVVIGSRLINTLNIKEDDE